MVPLENLDQNLQPYLQVYSQDFYHIVRVEVEEQGHTTQADSGEAQDPAVAGRKWIDSKPGRAPKDVEEFYEMHLDAMRLPKGVIVKCSMPGGGSINIPGSDLQRPIHLSIPRTSCSIIINQ